MRDVQCKGVDGDGHKADGTLCQAPFVDPETGCCPAHGPGASARQRERGRKGAEATRRRFKGQGTVKASKAPAPPETMEDAAKLASWATHAAITGELDPKRADVVIRGIREFRSAHEKAALEAEIKELRAEIEEANRGPDGD